MFNIEARTTRSTGAPARRVLIVDASPASARRLSGQLRAIAPCLVWRAGDIETALGLVDAVDPHLIFAEQDERVNGLAFTRALRRGDLAGRKTPVILCAATATAAAIVAARDAGAHEFLKRPFTSAELARRIEAVSLTRRGWVEAVCYVGPDRRRFNAGDYAGPARREADFAETPADARLAQALRIVRGAAEAAEAQPQVVRRVLAAQAAELMSLAEATGDADLAAAVRALEATLAGSEPLRATDLQPHVASLMAFMPGAPTAAAAA